MKLYKVSDCKTSHYPPHQAEQEKWQSHDETRSALNQFIMYQTVAVTERKT